MFISKLLLFGALSSISYSASVQKTQVKISLYYEAFCPYCHEFILDQLYPGYQKLGDALLLDLVPFGNAYGIKTDDGIEWSCQHGPMECYLNKIYACAINHPKLSQAEFLSYIVCDTKGTSSSMSEAEIQAVAQQCADDNNLPWEDVALCLKDGTADKLLSGYEDRQKKLIPTLEYVPHIRFNDIYNSTAEHIARNDLVAEACELFKDNKPSVCN